MRRTRRHRGSWGKTAVAAFIAVPLIAAGLAATTTAQAAAAPPPKPEPGTSNVKPSPRYAKAYFGEQAWNKPGARNERAGTVAAQLRTYYQSHHADGFIDVAVRADGTHIILRPGTPAPAAGVGGDVPVHTDYVDRPSLATLYAGQEKFRADILTRAAKHHDEFLKLGGGMYGADTATGTVRFVVIGNDPAKIAAMEKFLRGLHPDVPISVVGGGNAHPLQDLANGGIQSKDVNPFDGAAGVKVYQAPGVGPAGDGYVPCTSWANLRDGIGQIWGATSAHCNEGNANYNGGSYPVHTRGTIPNTISGATTGVVWASFDHNPPRYDNGSGGSPGTANLDTEVFPYVSDFGSAMSGTSDIWAENFGLNIEERRVIGPGRLPQSGDTVCNSNVEDAVETCIQPTVSYNNDFVIINTDGAWGYECYNNGTGWHTTEGSSGSPWYLANSSDTGVATASIISMHTLLATGSTMCGVPQKSVLAGLVDSQYGPSAAGGLGASLFLNDAPMVPNKPGAPNAALDGAGNLVMSWAAPNSDGGRAVTNYTIQYADASTLSGGVYSGWTLLGTTGNGTPSKTFTPTDYGSALTAGKSYVFRVQASNVIGDSLWSDASSGTTNGGIYIGTVGLNDSFNRTVSGGGLGTADSGQTWTNEDGATIGGTAYSYVGISGNKVVGTPNSTHTGCRGCGVFADAGVDTWDATFTYTGTSAPAQGAGDLWFSWRGHNTGASEWGGWYNLEPQDRGGTNNGKWTVVFYDYWGSGAKYMYRTNVAVARNDKIRVSNHPGWWSVYVNGTLAAHANMDTKADAKGQLSNYVGFTYGPSGSTSTEDSSYDDLRVVKSNNPGADASYGFDHFDRSDTTTGLGNNPVGTPWQAGNSGDLSYWKIASNTAQGIWDNGTTTWGHGHFALTQVGAHTSDGIRISAQLKGATATAYNDGHLMLIGRYVDANNWWGVTQRFDTAAQKNVLVKDKAGTITYQVINGTQFGDGKYVQLEFHPDGKVCALTEQDQGTAFCTTADTTFANNGGQLAGVMVESAPTSTSGTVGVDKFFAQSYDAVTAMG